MFDRSQKRERIGVDTDRRALSVNHLGYTLRSLFGAASSAGPVTEESSKWTIRYKGKEVGFITLKVFDDD